MNTAVLQTARSYEEERGKPMPSKNHAIVQLNLGIELAKHKDCRVMSELSLELNGRPFTPDLSVYPRQPADFRYDEIRLTEPPLMIVEIPSPTQGFQEIMEKVEAYLESGVKTCWVVNPPQKTITVYGLDSFQKSFVEGHVQDPVTGLTADLDAVFS